MARTRSQNYDSKRQMILDQWAELFATHGYGGTSISMVAKACGVSKALLYHYYPDKESVLYDLLSQHLRDLLEAVARVPPGEDRLFALTVAVLQVYRQSQRHKVLHASLPLLPKALQATLRDMERQLVAVFAEAIAVEAPQARDSALLKPVTMSFFGMLNTSYLWFRDGGALTLEDYARMVTRLVTRGLAT